MSTRNLFLPLTLIAALHATAPAIVLSQENNDNPEQLAPISITATRNPIRTFEYPGMVSVIGGEAIHAGQPSTSDDILRAVPNLEFTGGPRRSGETPSLRGFDGPDIVILLDGARQNFGAAHDGRFFLDPSLLREVEVLRGPASSLYGSGGTGGVIEFRTVDARDLLAADESAGVAVTVGHQSVNDERSATFLGYARPTMALDFIGAVTKRESGDIQLGDGNALTDTEDDILSALIKGGWDFNEHHRLESSLQRFANDAKEPNNGQGAGGADIVAKDIRADNWRLAYRYTNPAAALLDLDIVAYRTETQADERRLDANGAGPVGELLRRDMDTTGLRIDNRSRLPSAHGIATTFTYGGEIYRDEQDGAAGEGERDGVPDAEADYRGLFAQAEMVIGEPLGMLPGDLSIVAGLRHDSFEMSSPIAANAPRDSERSPRLSASYLPTDWLMFFASYAEAFRAATLDERFLTGTHSLSLSDRAPPLSTVSSQTRNCGRSVPKPWKSAAASPSKTYSARMICWNSKPHTLKPKAKTSSTWASTSLPRSPTAIRSSPAPAMARRPASTLPAPSCVASKSKAAMKTRACGLRWRSRRSTAKTRTPGKSSAC